MPRRGRGRGRGAGGQNQDLPGVCMYFNRLKKGCNNGDSCKFLHICRNIFNENGCRFGRKCRFSHDLTDTQPAKILQQYNISPHEVSGEFIDLFRTKVNAQFAKTDAGKKNEEEETDGESSSDGEDASSDDDDNPVAVGAASTSQTRNQKRRAQYRQRRKRNRQSSATADDMVGLMSETPDDSPSITEICAFYVKGNCKHGDKCTRLHTPSKLPYQWQVQRDSQWKYFDDNLNKRIEAAFCDPANEKIDKVRVGKILYTIEFASMKMSHQHKVSCQYLEIQRLSTLPSISNRIKSVATYSTHWVWYVKRQGSWLDVSKEVPPPIGQDLKTGNSNEMLEKAYIKILQELSKHDDDIVKQQFGLQASEQFVNLETMLQASIQKIVGERWEEISRRPRVYAPDSGQRSGQLSADAASTSRNEEHQKIKTGGMPVQDKTSSKPQEQQKHDLGSQHPSSGVKQKEATSGARKKCRDVSSQQTKTNVSGSVNTQKQKLKDDRKSGLSNPKQSVDVKPKEVKPPVTTQVVKTDQVKSSKATHPDKATKAKTANIPVPARDESNAVELCADYRWDVCSITDCDKMHVKSPYQWLYRDMGKWKKFQDNFKIEQIFSDPSNDDTFIVIGDLRYKVQFDYMSVTSDCLMNDPSGIHIRRVSTMSRVRCKEHWLRTWCIEWHWYWEDEYGDWIPYSQENSKGMKSDVSSEELETAYCNYLNGDGSNIYPFSTHNHNYYELNFAAMYQKNLVYQTKRAVRRRPQFLTHNERFQLTMKDDPLGLDRFGRSEEKKKEKPAAEHPADVPKTWDMEVMSDDDSEPKKVALNIRRHRDEYKKVEDIFCETMEYDEARIVDIYRVQNLELWHYFTQKRDWMIKKNKGRPVLEKQLWHGTNKESCEAICRQNFDFRISGSNVGTLYGQGSYFASDANYSDKYSRPEDNLRRMFLVRVLVGSYTAGKKEHKRPPVKDPSKPGGDLYDCCVDDMYDPSIYVIFEKSQAYPEYLIEYIRSSDLETTSYRRGTASRASSSSTISKSRSSSSSRYVNQYGASSSQLVGATGGTGGHSHTSAASYRSPPVPVSSSHSSSLTSGYRLYHPVGVPDKTPTPIPPPSPPPSPTRYQDSGSSCSLQ